MREIFVFSSNLAGRHGKGAAKYAYTHHGAIYGVGEGLTGNSYAIPTKDRNIRTLPLDSISKSVDKFKEFARLNQHLTFIVTPIGTGLAGYSHQDIAPLFRNCPPNCQMPNEWADILRRRFGQ